MTFYINNKKVIIFLSILIFLCIFFFISRNLLLEKVFKSVNYKLHQKYNLELTFKEVRFQGISGISIKGFLIKDSLNNTVAQSDSIFFNIKIGSVLFGQLRLKKLYIKKFDVSIDGFLFEKLISSYHIRKDLKDGFQKSNYAKLINREIDRFFSIIPNEVFLDSIIYRYSKGNNNFKIVIQQFKFNNNILNSHIYISDQLNHSGCLIRGIIDKTKKAIDIIAFGSNKNNVEIPYIDAKWGLELKFDTLHFGFYSAGFKKEKQNFSGFIQSSNLIIKHKLLAPTKVFTKKESLEFTLNVGNRFIELDSVSKITFNNFSFSPYLKYQNFHDREIFIRIPYKIFSPDTLIKSFPEGLFTTIRDMKVSGKLAFEMNCYIDLDQPDSLKFNSKLENKGFKIQQFGSADLNMLNDTFSFKYFNADQTAKTFMVNPNNPDYVQLENISPFLRFSVLTSEDGDFFYHKGFNEESFKNSIIKNIKEKRFARGGSTITMQLVKNIFLTRDKTIPRKLEEMIITWMIEDLHLVSKDRMFEIYLNIIEWGPGIYGIKQASKYYFKKLPKELNLNESIFLASIIPSPKYFKYAFKEPGKLTDFYSWFYQYLPYFMIQRNQITPEDTIGLKPEVILTGEAKDYLVKPDTLVIDSSEIIEPLILDEKIIVHPEK